MPADLVDRVKFAMSVAALEAEVAEIVSSATLETVRGTDYDRADTVTFASEGLSVMVTIEHGAATRADIVGWVSEGDVEVELRERGRTRTTVVDDEGRFTFPAVERGLVNFVLRRRERRRGTADHHAGDRTVGEPIQDPVAIADSYLAAARHANEVGRFDDAAAQPRPGRGRPRRRQR